MTREEAIRLIGWLKCTTNREDDLEAMDMAIEALNNSIQMSNIQELQAENGFLKEMVKFYREQQTVEVVRCKDCRHRDLFSCPLADNDFQKDEDFCSWGERSEP